MLRQLSVPDALEERGISRREFLNFCAAMVATLALPPRYLGTVVEALERTDRPVLVWLEFQDCAGNTESMLRSSDPPVADVVLELFSWEYHETIMAGAGKQAEAALKQVDQDNRPLFAYGQLIHDQCERRAHYDAGRFVEEWGDEGSRKGWCLYKMGCKGPDATYNCPTVRWNGGTSWPVKSGHGCIACASNRFWDRMSPFYKPLPKV